MNCARVSAPSPLEGEGRGEGRFVNFSDKPAKIKNRLIFRNFLKPDYGKIFAKVLDLPSDML
jgi:hypothetical protein